VVKLVVYSLAAWRLAYMLVHETGPGNLFQVIRRCLGVETVNGVGNAECEANNPRFGMFCCVFCMSIWTSAVLQMTVHPVKVLAVSAGALIVDRIANP
jgi:hypothetical protein